MPFQPGNKEALKGSKPKPYRDALRMELARDGDELKELRLIARAQIEAAKKGDLQAGKEIADRLDGKPAQEISGTIDHKHDRTDWSRDELVEIIRNASAGSDGAAMASGRGGKPH